MPKNGLVLPMGTGVPNVANAIGILPAAKGGTATANTAAIANGSVKITCADAAPSAPTADDLWYETDTNILWFWNGTYWLSKELYDYGMSFTAVSATTAAYFGIEPIQAAQHDIYFVDVTASLFIDTTNDGSKFWTATINRLSSANTPTAIGSCNTSAISASAWTVVKATLNTHVDLSAVDAKATQISVAKTSTPGDAYGRVDFTYRLAHL